jgi:DNA-binding NtrC family response regulator
VQPSVLIIEDEEGVRTALVKRLKLHGCHVDAAATGEDGLKRLAEAPADLILLDYRLPDADGLELLERIRRQWPDTLTVMMTAYTNVDIAINAIRLGAYDYVSKPFSLDEMMVVVDKALEAKRLRSEVERLRTTQAEEFGFEHIVARSPKMTEILTLLKHLAESEARTILLQGESGTGKDLAAKVLHYNSPRRGLPFMNITCTALPETLLESELFGHEKGAFTDARTQKKGLFELADGGTIFLDEIGDMPATLQAKLLRFLEEKTFRRVGGTSDIVVDVRIIAATNRDLRRLVEEGRFREDLFYRLNIFPVTLPPLRERPEDIALLAEYFVRQYNREFRKEVTGIEPAAQAVMQAYGWPGNVREMRNLMERAMLLASPGRLTVDALPAELKDSVVDPALTAAAGFAADRPGAAPSPARAAPGAPVAHAATGAARSGGTFINFGPEGIDIHEVERLLIERALEHTRGNQSRAAALLHLSRDQLRYRMQKYNLKTSDAETPAPDPA